MSFVKIGIDGLGSDLLYGVHRRAGLLVSGCLRVSKFPSLHLGYGPGEVCRVLRRLLWFAALGRGAGRFGGSATISFAV